MSETGRLWSQGIKVPAIFPAGTELGWAASVPQKSQVKCDSGVGWRLFFGLGLGSQQDRPWDPGLWEGSEPRPSCWWGEGLLTSLARQLGGRFLSGEPRLLGPGFFQLGKKQKTNKQKKKPKTKKTKKTKPKTKNPIQCCQGFRQRCCLLYSLCYMEFCELPALRCPRFFQDCDLFTFTSAPCFPHRK
jgi:hypothetical protein